MVVLPAALPLVAASLVAASLVAVARAAAFAVVAFAVAVSPVVLAPVVPRVRVSATAERPAMVASAPTAVTAGSGVSASGSVREAGSPQAPHTAASTTPVNSRGRAEPGKELPGVSSWHWTA